MNLMLRMMLLMRRMGKKKMIMIKEHRHSGGVVDHSG